MRGLLAACALACAPTWLSAAPPSDKDSESDLNVKFGYDHTAGKYDQRRDSTLSTSSVTATYDAGDYAFDIMVPYLRESGPGRVLFLPGHRPVILIGPDRTARGMGDVTGGVTRYLLDQETHGLDLDLEALVKFGTASSTKGLGTGKNDLAVQAAFGRSLGDLEGTLTTGYTLVGKAAGFDLQNSFYGSFDLSYKVAAPVRIGATYSAGQSAAKGTSGSRDGTAYVEFTPWKGLKVELYYLKGWSTQSPDRGGGVSVSCDL